MRNRNEIKVGKLLLLIQDIVHDPQKKTQLASTVDELVRDLKECDSSMTLWVIKPNTFGEHNELIWMQFLAFRTFYNMAFVIYKQSFIPIMQECQSITTEP